MSNLAKKYQEDEQVLNTVQDQSKILTRKSWLTPGEKLIGIAFAGLVCFGAVHIISNQSEIYQANKSIQDVKSSISEQQKENGDLQMQVSQLSNYQRILAKAKQMGLVLNENNVKVVQGK